MVHSVLIVGGGASGWMSASYSKAAFGDEVDLTLVESNRIETIGVGETAFSTVRHFLEAEGAELVKVLPSTREYLTGRNDRQDRAPGSAPTL